MSISENINSNGWQNIGIMVQYASKNIKFKNRQVFIFLVQESFGYGMRKTLQKSQEYWSNKIGITKPTFNSQVKELEDDGHIKINHQKGFVVGGGKKAYSYSPTFPSNARIWIKADSKEKNNMKEEVDTNGAKRWF